MHTEKYERDTSRGGARSGFPRRDLLASVSLSTHGEKLGAVDNLVPLREFTVTVRSCGISTPFFFFFFPTWSHSVCRTIYSNDLERSTLDGWGHPNVIVSMTTIDLRAYVYHVFRDMLGDEDFKFDRGSF